jgi:hypothetical protein
MDDRQWHDASTEEKLNWLRDPVNWLADTSMARFATISKNSPRVSKPKRTLEDPDSR